MPPVVSSLQHTPSPVLSHRPVAAWLLAVAALVFLMVVVGGVTRLTRSGLSIVEWNPVTGAIPPLTEQQWLAEFEKYQRTPEYQLVNKGMSLEAFQRIFYVEWAHRLLGRLIGFAVFLPLVWFMMLELAHWLLARFARVGPPNRLVQFVARRRIGLALLSKLTAIFVLGGLQGALGWFMVKSGLVDVPRVSPYRLTAHLGLAVAIYGFLLWVALDLLAPASPRAAASPTLRRTGWTVTALVFLVILAGGFVAGTKAGFTFNTFPLMNGRFVPEGLYAMTPWWTNLFENVATVQFDHRVLAYALVLAVLYYWNRARRDASLPAGVRRAFHLLLAAVAAQVSLGIATLLLIVPIPLGALHQAGALAVFTIAVYLNHAQRASSSVIPRR